MAKWNDVNLIITSSKYLKLREGENKVRIVSEAGVIAKHWQAGKMLGICIGKDEGCQFCAEGVDLKPKWICWAIDRTDGKIKELEIGYTVVQQINKLAQSEEYKFSDIPPFDLSIFKTGQMLETEYSVLPSRKDVPLTEEEKAGIAKLMPISELIEKKKKITETEPF